MLRRTFALVTTTLAVGAGVIAGAAPASAAPAPAPAAVVTLTYDDSQAAEFKSAVAQGAANWNASVTNVRLVKATLGQRVNIRVIADDGWPRATLGPVRPTGSGTVWFGRQAVDDGYNVVRIITHEFGHSLGLPDRRTGLCSDLMSGSSAPVSCANALPNATERAQVQRNYASALVAQPVETTILVDAA
ncbi:snapalysin family zinc-dependent metalloprotease [Actinokineospora sp. PR83]|uniref:snapalysin family zinc-dependent metalloprotease n=1 Tax=Actinokineospora sp. PR83 TaxID=2884908 RepID=UPI001F26FDC4|nr:snapalysin family zinc-dependent metalloprotease [Actinokineospora sp. PR83]MCG8914395.1 snapalysin family zinc-dependent metalloprotease [Actinokineospora sp. PR83]